MLNFILYLLSIVIILRSNLTYGTNNFKIMTSLPAGEFRLSIKAVHNCNPIQNNKLQFNYYRSHNTYNDEIKINGNLTNTIPFDDTLSLNMNIATKDSSGAWKDNTYIQKFPKASSDLKSVIGSGWTTLAKGLGIPENCPTPPGIYTGSGLDIATIIKKSNFPKTFIYGSYKVRFYLSRNKEIYGCHIFIIDILRP